MLRQPPRRRLLALLLVGAPLLLLPVPEDAAAQVFKCRDDRGRTQYSDRPCVGQAQTYRPPELNRIPAEQLTGNTKQGAAAGKDRWVSPLDPVAQCEKQGGRFSREYRGCLLP